VTGAALLLRADARRLPLPHDLEVDVAGVLEEAPT